MSNRDMCISVINSMEEWQLQSVLEMLNAVKGTMDKLESGVLETARLQSDPEMRAKLIDGKKTTLSECIPENAVTEGKSHRNEMLFLPARETR